MSLKLYIDWLSQPSRFVSIVLNLLKVEHEVVETRIMEGKQRSEEYTKINPFRKVPAIQDGDFNLAESHTIARYIIRSRNITTSLYPINDPKIMAKVDEYLDYHHTSTRKLSQLFFNSVLAPKLNLPITTNTEQLKKEIHITLKYLDNLLSKQQFIVGNTLTLADISAYCELMQGLLIKYDYTPYQNIVKWMQRVSEIKEVKDGHKALLHILEKAKNKAKL